MLRTVTTALLVSALMSAVIAAPRAGDGRPGVGAASAARPPYPPSRAISGIRWAPPESIFRDALGSDNWPMTWGDDDRLYTAYGDGFGFSPKVPAKLSLGFARVSGTPPALSGENVRSATLERKGDGERGEKASGILMVEGVLYLLIRNARNARLGWSSDHGKTWTCADWRFTTSFGCPTFLNFGRHYAGARDGYVYVYSPDQASAYEPADRMVMARVPRDRLRERDAYESFEGLDADGKPRWTADVARRGAVFSHAGRCYRSGVSYNAGLRRYLWCQVLPAKRGNGRGHFAVYDAPEPWGPWTTVYYTEAWDVDPGETCSFPTRWMSADGRTLHLLFSGDDSFAVRRAVLTVAR